MSLSNVELPKKTNGTGVVAARTPASLKITRATRADMHHAVRIVSSTAEWYRPLLNEKDMAEHAVDQAWADKNYSRREFFIGRVDGEVVGIATLQHAGDYVYVGYVYVDEQAVGKGHGRRLLAHVARIAEERGYKGLVLIAHPEATWAVRAYLKFGFRVAETDREKVLAWNGGYLKPFYEEGFSLFAYDFRKPD